MEGIVGVVLGIVAFVWPGETALILLSIVAVWAIITGIMEIGASFTVRDWLTGLAGILSLALGVLLIARPGAGLPSPVVTSLLRACLRAYSHCPCFPVAHEIDITKPRVRAHLAGLASVVTGDLYGEREMAPLRKSATYDFQRS